MSAAHRNREGGFGRTVAAVWTLVLCAGYAAGCAGQPATPERIVLVVVDTLRRDYLSCYGAKRPTPNIDALAARGQRFTNAYSAFHQTTMSMAALFTGRTPSLESGAADAPLPWNGRTWCGLRRFSASVDPDAECVPPAVGTLAERLRASGYETLGVASNHFLFHPAGYARGFDDWTEVGREDAAGEEGGWRQSRRRSRARSREHVHAAVEAALDRRRGDRFLLYVHYMDVHDYRPRGMRYADGVAEADAAVGELAAALEARGLLDGATLVLTSDHGERLGETHAVEGLSTHSGNPSFETLLRVPLIVAPATLRDSAALLRGQDVFALIAALGGAEPAAAAPELDAGELFVTESRWQTYRKGRWKSARSRADDRHVLFDLARDPAETQDVAARHPNVVAAHARRIDVLTGRLAAGDTGPTGLTDEDRSRLRALGYAD